MREVREPAAYDPAMGLFRSAMGLFRGTAGKDREKAAAELPNEQRGVPAAVRQATEEVEAYFAHRLTEFSVPVAPAGTEFQRLVWANLALIAYGETESYGELAARIGRPSACRAVGLANGRNPIPLILPCHRVIGANGSLTGYGGGLPLKLALLEHERSYAGRVAATGRRSA